MRDYRLGYAVASSACVPGLFEPLAMKGLYPGRVVRLVDGGVHDNQGVQGLLNESCTWILCSDASGQMADQAKPSDSTIGVPLRSNSILMDRVRESEYQDLSGRVANGALEGLFFIHLKKGLPTKPVDWVDCDDPSVADPYPFSTTPYGVDRELQAQLAATRTDLDSFSEVEAYALMLSGYLMAEHEFKELDEEHRREGGAGRWGGYWIDAPRENWPFLDLEPIVRKPKHDSDLRREDLGMQVAAGASLFFKIWKLSQHRLEVIMESFRLTAKLDWVEKRGGRTAIHDCKTSASKQYLSIHFMKLDPGNRETWSEAIGTLQLPVYLTVYSQAAGEKPEDIDCLFLLLGRNIIDPAIELPLSKDESEFKENFEKLTEIIFRLLKEIVDPGLPFLPTVDPRNRCGGCLYGHICTNPMGRA